MRSAMLTNMFIVTLFVCLSVKCVSCLECYECTSDSDSACTDKFYSGKTAECSDSECSTIIKVFDASFIIRSCGREKYNQLDAEGNLGLFTCNTDLCNGLKKKEESFQNNIEQTSNINVKTGGYTYTRETTHSRSTGGNTLLSLFNNDVVYKSNVFFIFCMVLFSMLLR